MAETSEPEIFRLSLLQQRISVGTWFITLLLSLRGLFEFYGMKQKGSVEQAVAYMTEPFVQLFQFSFLQNLDIPAITVLFTAISLLIASYSLRLFLKYTEARLRTRRYLARQFIVVSNKY